VGTKPSITLLLILAIFIPQAELFPQDSSLFPRLEPDPRALEYYELGRRNSGYTWTELAQISIWASGAQDEGASLARIMSAAAGLNSSPSLPASGREKAEYILAYLHRNILKSYSIFQTRVDTVFVNGSFNCVSSAVLFTILCESAGIKTSAVITRDHAFAMVHIDGQDIDVETTNRYGFDPGNRREFHDQFGRLTGFTYVPAQNYRDRQTISNIQLVSLILNNRIAEQERRNNFAASVPLAVDRAALLLGESSTAGIESSSSASIFQDPRRDLVDRLLNFGATLLRANREDDSLHWARIASSKYPHSSRWQEYVTAAVNNRITRFLRERKTDEADVFLENNKALLTDADYAQFDSVIFDAAILNRANQSRTAAEGDAIINDIKNGRDAGRMNERRAIELLTYTIQRTAASLCAAPARDWRLAVNYIQSHLSLLGANRELEQALQTYRNNLAADYHNRFAAEWNRRNYEEAQRILNEGLLEFPDNRQLLSNMEIVNRQRSN